MINFIDYLCEAKAIKSEPILEAGLARLIKKISDEDFCIVSAYRNENTEKENKKRHKELVQTLNSMKIGPYELVGSWEEDVKDSDNKVIGKKHCEEESVAFIKPTDMSHKEFEKLVEEMIKKWKEPAVQEAAMMRLDGVIYVKWKDGSREKLEKQTVSLKDIGKNFSVMKKFKHLGRGFVLECKTV